MRLLADGRAAPCAQCDASRWHNVTNAVRGQRALRLTLLRWHTELDSEGGGPFSLLKLWMQEAAISHHLCVRISASGVPGSGWRCAATVVACGTVHSLPCKAGRLGQSLLAQTNRGTVLTAHHGGTGCMSVCWIQCCIEAAAVLSVGNTAFLFEVLQHHLQGGRVYCRDSLALVYGNRCRTV